MKHLDLGLGKTFAPHTLRIKYEPLEGSMMIDLATIASLELIQNLQNTNSRDCLFGLLNQTHTRMGSRFLRSNVLQPSTDAAKIRARQDAVEELVSNDKVYFAVRSGTSPVGMEELADQY
jgi:DNA mismatch repair protein MSH4